MWNYFPPSVFSPIVPVTVVDVIPAAPDSLLKDYRPQTCAVDGCDLPVYNAGNKPSASACLRVH